MMLIRTMVLASLTMGSVFATPLVGVAQTDPDNVPSPPAEELERLERFFGTFRHTDQYYDGAGPFNGTLEVRPAIKGWYVEFVIDTRWGPIDRELRMLVTYDAGLERYRVWRFATVPQTPPGTPEGTAWFEGDDFVMLWRGGRAPDGPRGIFRNRVRMEGPDEIVIYSDAQPDWEETVRLGVWRSHRVEGGR